MCLFFFPLLKYHPESLYLIVVFIVLSVLNEFAGIMGKVLGGQRRYDGPMGKSDRALLVGIYGLISYFGSRIHLFSSDFLHHHCPVAPEYFYPLKKRTLCRCPIVNMPCTTAYPQLGGHDLYLCRGYLPPLYHVPLLLMDKFPRDDRAGKAL